MKGGSRIEASVHLSTPGCALEKQAQAIGWADSMADRLMQSIYATSLLLGRKAEPRLLEGLDIPR